MISMDAASIVTTCQNGTRFTIAGPYGASLLFFVFRCLMSEPCVRTNYTPKGRQRLPVMCDSDRIEQYVQDSVSWVMCVCVRA